MITLCDIAPYRSGRVLCRADDCLYVLPHPALRPYIANYTLTFPQACRISSQYMVLPNASATAVLCFDGSTVRCDLFGAATKSCAVGERANQYQQLLIVEFQPGGLYRFTGVAQAELADQIFALDAVAGALQRRLVQAMQGAKCVDALLRALDEIFLDGLRLTEQYAPCDALLLAVDGIVCAGGMVQGKALSQSVYYSQRHLNRIFKRYIGAGVQSFTRLVRINRAVKCLQSPHLGIAQTAELTGYYDCAHFTHDFKHICGVTPREYLDNLSDFYNAIAKF